LSEKVGEAKCEEEDAYKSHDFWLKGSVGRCVISLG
jgi:hypothetical protein